LFRRPEPGTEGDHEVRAPAQGQGLQERFLLLERERVDLRPSAYVGANGIAKAIGEFDWVAHAARVETARRAAEHFVDATQRAFAGEAIPGVLSEAWRAFIQAGERYLKHVGVRQYPGEKDACAYCRQPLSATAVELIRKYRRHCNNSLRQELDAANAAVTAGVNPIARLDLRGLSDRTSRRVAAIGGDPPRALALVTDLLVAAGPLQEEMKKGVAVDAASVIPLAREAAALTAKAIARADESFRP
jgi:hypothetical protein